MNLETKKDLTSNWFKTLQDAFCDNINKIEKNRITFKSTTWKKNKRSLNISISVAIILAESLKQTKLI